MSVITCSDDLVAILRARKAEINLSNSFVEDQLQLGDGNADKFIGLVPTKGMSLSVLLDLIELLGGRLVFEVCAETEARMRARWEQRDARKVHPSPRVSKAILDRAKPVFHQLLGAAGGHARARSLPAKQRSEIARTAALSRWKQHRAAAKARALAEGVSP